MSEEKMRAEFEKSALDMRYDLAKGHTQLYAYENTQSAWLLWQAATASKQREIDTLKSSFAEVQYNQAQLIRDYQSQVLELSAQVEVMREALEKIAKPEKLQSHGDPVVLRICALDALRITTSDAISSKYVADACYEAIIYFSHPVQVGDKIYTSPIPPADVAELQRDLAESEEVREMMKKILDDIAIALKGPNAELSLHSWHDLAEVASRNALEAGSRIAELEDCKSAMQKIADYWRTRSAELERKLAQYQAVFHDTDGAPELEALISEAREKGRKEAVPDGWRVVPKIATRDMQGSGALTTYDKGLDISVSFEDCGEIYTAMLAAAPSHALNAKEGGE